MLDFDWRRLMRWSLLGAVVMTLWLLAPVTRCSWKSFADEPLDEAHPMSGTSGSHEDSVPISERGFFSRWGASIKACYARTPLLGQETWKRNLLLGFAGATVLFWTLSSLEKKKKSEYTRS